MGTSVRNETIDDLIRSKRVLILCGSGGVGKTTSSGALALRAAELGRRTVVVTIDPAKRLATSLGISSLSSTPSNLTHLIKGKTPSAGELWAVMPDTNEVFESFIKSMAKTQAKAAERVLRTSIYKIFVQDFSGANEYMAMEKLSQLYLDPRFDLIVLDTPPAPNAVAFLKAPGQLARFFDDSLMKWFIAPGSKLLAAGIKRILEILERLTGKGFISELVEFTAALFELKVQFIANLTEIEAVLRSSSTSFIMVTTPERYNSADTTDFVEHLVREHYPFWGFLVNRSLTARLGIANKASLATIGPVAACSEQEQNFLNALFDRQRSRIEKEFTVFESCKKKNANVATVQAFDQDIHNVDDLADYASKISSIGAPSP